MPILQTRRQFLTLAASIAACTGRLADAEEIYPVRTIKLVVPYSPGGGADIMARVMAPALGTILKQTVVVENKPGGSAIIGTEYVTNAAPDGYTLLLTQDDPAINPAIYQNLPYDTLEALIPISKLATFPFYLAVKGDSPIQTIHDLVAFAGAHPDKATFASTGATFWLLTELFAQKTGLKLTRITYRGGGAMVLAVMSGEVLFTFAGAGPISAPASSGSIRVIGTTAPHRDPAFPNVPTLTEAGIPGMDVLAWSSLWAPAKTPATTIEALSKAARAALAMPEVVAEMDKIKEAPDGSTPESFKRSLIAEMALWKEVARKAGISAKL